MNPWWSFKMYETGEHKFMFPKALTSRSQDLDDLYCPTGSIWVAKLSNLLKDGTFYGKGHRFSEIPWESAVDIDDWPDLAFAQKIAMT
jgi:N-acylneuraminate cytidylyltransferase